MCISDKTNNRHNSNLDTDDESLDKKDNNDFKSNSKRTNNLDKISQLQNLTIWTLIKNNNLSFQKTTFYNGECYCSRQQPK